MVLVMTSPFPRCALQCLAHHGHPQFGIHQNVDRCVLARRAEPAFPDLVVLVRGHRRRGRTVAGDSRAGGALSTPSRGLPGRRWMRTTSVLQDKTPRCRIGWGAGGWWNVAEQRRIPGQHAVLRVGWRLGSGEGCRCFCGRGSASGLRLSSAEGRASARAGLAPPPVAVTAGSTLTKGL